MMLVKVWRTLLTLVVAISGFFQVVESLQSCACPGGGDCYCVDRDSCTGAGVQDKRWPASSCSTPDEVCCRRSSRARRQAVDNSGLLDACGLATPSRELPWAVAIYQWDNATSTYQGICPGVLIHPQVVLTSASCTPELTDVDDEFLVYAGGDEGTATQARLVTMLGRHDYYAQSGEFDVALLFLDAPFALGDDVRVLCLPQKNTPLDTEQCVSTRLDQNGFLQKTRMRLQEYVEDCMAMLPEDIARDKSFPEYNSFCAISREGTSLCGENDEGSALACPLAADNRRLAVHGVVALAPGCTDASLPVIYTNTTYLATWIQVRLALLGLENFAIPP